MAHSSPVLTQLCLRKTLRPSASFLATSLPNCHFFSSTPALANRGKQRHKSPNVRAVSKHFKNLKFTSRARRNIIQSAQTGRKSLPLPASLTKKLQSVNEKNSSPQRFQLVSITSDVARVQNSYQNINKMKYRGSLLTEVKENQPAVGEEVLVSVKGKEAHFKRRGVFIKRPSPSKKDITHDESSEFERAFPDMDSLIEAQEKSKAARFELMELSDDVRDAMRYAILCSQRTKGTISKEEREELVHKARTTSVKPTAIQALAIPAILEGREHVLCAAETGSGKTLAYMAPIVQRFRVEEEKMTELATIRTGAITIRSNSPTVKSSNQISDASVLQPVPLVRRTRRPRAIILVPSRELVLQVLETAKDLSHVAKFTVEGIVSNTPNKTVERILSQPLDILVTTPGTVLSLCKEKQISLSAARHLVIDEGDSMFLKGFGNEVREIVKTIKAAALQQNTYHQIVVVTATLPKSVGTLIEEEFPNLLKVTTPALHRPLRNLKHSFVDVRKDFNSNREAALLDVIRKCAEKGEERIMVFCNQKKQARRVSNFLTEKGLAPLVVHGYIDDRNREASIEYFKSDDFGPFVLPVNNYIPVVGKEYQKKKKTTSELASLPSSPGMPKLSPVAKNGDMPIKIMVCTDIASRGIDLPNVDHIVQFDFPTSVVDYLHRVGRTARAGRSGGATTLVRPRDRRVADKIQKAIKFKKVIG